MLDDLNDINLSVIPVENDAGNDTMFDNPEMMHGGNPRNVKAQMQGFGQGG